MADEPQRFCLGIAYMPGRDPRISKGADGGRDFLTEAELEKAAWSFLRSGPKVNAFHMAGTEGCATVVESSIHRGPDWDLGDGIVVTKGTWLVGAILDDRMWQAAQTGKVNGWSPEGTARRRTVRKGESVAIAKGALMADDDGEDFTEIVGAEIPTMALVGKGANGIPRFLVMKDADNNASGLLDPEFVRDLIAKAEPEPSGRERVTMPSGLTLTGSPGDIAAFIHKAAQRAETREVPEVTAVAKSAAAYDAILKAKYSAEDKRKMLAAGHAIKNDNGDPAYPIGDKDDLGKAIHAVGRGGADHDRIRAYVIRRAKALGASSMIPDNWNSDGSLKESVSKEDAVTGAVAKADVSPDLDDGVDGLDPTVPLAEPDEMGDGSPTDPGSPAWESIDAATASKWCSILARARVAVDLLAEREMLEAASADPDDAENACDLESVCCAIDYAISILAPFAVAEQSEADSGEMAMAKSAPDDDTWAGIAKAMADEDATAAALGTLEALGAVIRKSGRVLSSVNEAHIREAAARLNTVLGSLPRPLTDDGQPVAKMTPAEEAGMPEATPSEDVTAASGQQPAMGTAEPPLAAQEAVVTKAAPALMAAVFDHARRLIGLADPAVIHTDLSAVPVAKADTGDGKAPMCVVYNQAGKLIGIVDPADITPVANSEAEPDDTPDDDAAEAAAAPDAADMTPAPPADAGTPADDVAKGTRPEASTQDTDERSVLKSALKDALAELLGAQPPHEDIAKADVAGMRERLEEMAARLEVVEKSDAPMRVFSNGAVPPPGSVPPARPSLRGQDQGAAQPVDVAKAQEMRAAFRTADPAEQNRLAREMQEAAIAGLSAIHARR